MAKGYFLPKAKYCSTQKRLIQVGVTLPIKIDDTDDSSSSLMYQLMELLDPRRSDIDADTCFYEK
jgi:hypothetical protein